MGEIIGAGFLSHAPTIMYPESVRRELNAGKEISLVPGLHRLRSEVLDRLSPDAVVVFDTHWFTTVEFVLTAHSRRRGRYTSEELPRGMADIEYDLKGDPDLAKSIGRHVNAGGVRCHACEDPLLPIHYPTVNLSHFLNRGEAWLSVGICQTAQDHNFLAVGRAIADAVGESDRRVVLLASGGMSHRFWPLDELGAHEESDPSHVVTPEARAADEKRIGWWLEGNHAAVVDGMDEYRAHAPEGRFGHYLMMASAIGGRECRARGQLYSDYENATGTGQVHVWFERPATGWS
ncbi:MAG: catechol 1,2-dioxygenase [Gammaproteobacteria bacterium]|nr:catechol 1,2-dioxygenase [Gammaproteobacteria bacterium]MYD76894.1 catechol 1,2-dioxygenase [Gammaproteobacteria bacterium]MYJ51066.1 catechol 1,2-dioxygenase [Gammaproteobacteria bacterium]